MGKQVSIKKNFIMNALLSLSSIIFPLITTPYINRVLGTLNKGKVTTATAIISYFMIFAQLGIPAYGVKHCASVRDDKDKLSKAVHELLIINIVTSVIAYIALFIAVYVIPSFRVEAKLFWVMCPTIILNAIGIEWLYRALEKYDYITIRSLIFKVIAFVAMFFLVKSEKDYIIYGAITIFAASASSVLNFYNARKYIYFKKYDHYEFKKHISFVWVFFAMSCATTVYLHLDTIMIKFLSGDSDDGFAQAGIYDTAVKVKSILTTLVTSLGAVLLPRSSYYYKNKNYDEFRRITGKALNLVAFLSIPLMVYFMLFANEAVMFLGGIEFADSIFPMRTIMPTIVFIGITNIIGFQVLIPSGGEKVVLRSVVWGAVVDGIVNFILIPFLKCEGAAIGTLLAEIVVLIYQLVYMSRHKDIVDVGAAFRKIRFDKIAISVGAGIAASLVFKFVSIPVDLPIGDDEIMAGAFVTLALSAIVFFAVYGILMIVMKETMALEIWRSVTGKLGKLLRRKQA